MKDKTKRAFENQNEKQLAILCYAVITCNRFPDMEMIIPLYEGTNLPDYKKKMQENNQYCVRFVQDISEEDKRDLNGIGDDGVFIKDA